MKAPQIADMRIVGVSARRPLVRDLGGLETVVPKVLRMRWII